MKSMSALPVAQEPGRLRPMVSICAVLVAGIGLIALLGWVLGLPFLASLGSDKIPVAPSTAVLFVLYAVAVLLRAQLPARRGTYWIGLSINSAGALAALLLFILSYQGIRPDAEHLGFAIVNTAGEIPRGHMSPLTALCFLLAAMSFLASLSSSTRPRWATVAWWLACLLITIGFVLLLAYLYGVPLLYGSSFIPPAALTSMAFMALGIALLGLAWPQVRLFRRQAEATTRTSYAFILIFIILAAGIVTAGYLFYKSYGKRYRAEVERQLSTIADLKADEIARWRRERLGDAHVFYNNSNFSGLVRHYLEIPTDTETRERLRTWMHRIQEASQYDQLFLLDARGIVRMSAPEKQIPISRHASLRAAEALRTRQVAFEDFYRNEHDERVYLAVFVPILDERDNSRAVGTLVMRIDPEGYLYPFISRWPTPSRTAETLLVRREGNDALFLNDLRFHDNTALILRSSLDHKDMPAVQAALGHEGIVEGRDYRGVPVVADVRAVPDSPWFLVARMDISEVFAPVKERLWMMVGFVVVLLFGSGAGLGLVWRQQSVGFYRQQYKAAEEIRKLNEELEQKVVDRTAQLESANKELEAFSYSVSHDLRAPLRHLTGFVELLNKRAPETLDEKSKHYLKVISDSAQQMGRLVDDLLSFSRMGRVEMTKIRVGLDQIVKEALKELQTEMKERSIVWKIDPLPEAYGDPSMLRLVFVNLIQNAIKFTRARPDAQIEIGCIPGNPKYAVYFVRDNGAGFDMRYVDKLFGLFQRLHRQEEFEGTGVGLANVQRIIHRHGGTIWGQSSPDGGATFYFSLPKRRDEP